MEIGVRGKFFILSLLLDLALLMQLGFSVESSMEQRLDADIKVNLSNYAKTAQLLFEMTPGDASIEAIDHVADHLGEAINNRVTVIAHNGKVLGDSRLSLKDIRNSVENHKNRPEIIQAFAKGTGIARRFSDTLEQEMLYQAISFKRDNQTSVVRIAISTNKIRETILEQRKALLAASALAFGLAVFMTALAMEWITRTFRELVQRAAHITQDISDAPIPIQTNDEVGGLADSFNDIAKKLENTVIELAHDRSRLHAVLHGMSEGMIVLDNHRRIMLINESACTLLNLPRTIIGQHIEKILPSDALQPFLTQKDNPETEGMFCTHTMDWVDDSNRFVHIIGTNMPRERGCILVLRDVTEIRQMDQIQRDFVANVSHELRTPVHVILINAELLHDHLPPNDPICRKLSEGLESNAKRLSRIITNILYLSKLDADQQPMEITHVPILPLVQRAIQRVTDPANKQNIHISCHVDETVYALVNCEVFAEVLLFNLLDNAIKYSPKDANIVIRTRTMGENMRIEVEDNGPGIPLQSRNRIFERFFRVDISQSRTMGGTGLGLSIVKQLADKMNLQVGVEPVLPHGSLFWVSLPSPPPKKS